MEEFKGKTIIITGGASGIGKATAELFAKKGANVCIADVNNVEGSKLEQKLTEEGCSVKFIKTDVTDFKELETMVLETIKIFKKVDILFNSAGFEGRIKELKDTSIEEWDEVMNLHLKGCFLACKLVIPFMIKQGGGVIINIGSEIGTSFRFAPNYVPYGTSKAAVMAFTKALAIELAPSKIRVNCVSPGAIRTSMLEREIDKYLEKGFYKTREDAMGSINSNYPIGFIGEPIDIANAVAFLASEKSRYATGTILAIDGGSGII
jgi:NAD(P)-dependent dehydrogenase (short-subunit alcohol dehydrogenase family)